MNRVRGLVEDSLRRIAQGDSVVGMADGELLDRYVQRAGDPAELAFSALVERHGPMVLRVCRAILRDTHAAEDAFQATFLILARRARTLWVRDSLAPWLHEVAHRVSSAARTANSRRKSLNRNSLSEKPQPLGPPEFDDLGLALHEEVERLPARLKGALILCHMEGLTHEQAAARLSCPVGTVRSRLSRARERLRRELTRRGFASLSPLISLPTLNPSLVAASVKAAMRLAAGRSTLGSSPLLWSLVIEGVIIPMTLKPLKFAMILLMAGLVVAVGLGVNASQEPAKKPSEAPSGAEAALSDHQQVVALKLEIETMTKRLARLEAQLGQPSPEKPPGDLKPRDSIRRAEASETPPYKIRSRFAALVETVFVKPGQEVKKGDPLVTLHGPELAAAAVSYQTKFVQWDHDKKFLAAREPLFKEGRITQIVWIDTQNDEKKSRLDCLVARDKLSILGMKHSQIEEVIEEFTDEPQKKNKVDHTRGLVRLTITAPFDATVIESHAEVSDWTEPKDLLFVLKARDH